VRNGRWKMRGEKQDMGCERWRWDMRIFEEIYRK